eukprot:364625-Chlamydomonas_euryale.AAC.6
METEGRVHMQLEIAATHGNWSLCVSVPKAVAANTVQIGLVGLDALELGKIGDRKNRDGQGQVRPLLRTGVEKGCADIARVMVPNEIQMPQGLHAGSVPVFDKAGEMMVDDGMRRFDFDRVLKVDSSAVSKQLFQLAVPCVERFCQTFVRLYCPERPPLNAILKGCQNPPL